MSGNQVTLTFAGDSEKLEKAFDKVGQSADGMKRRVEDASEGFDRVGEAADEVDTKAMGFRDTLTGVQDTMGGLAQLAKGPSFEGFLTLGFGIGDLGSGLYNFLVPGLKSTVTWLKEGKLAAMAMNVVSGIMKIGTLAWTGAQWLLNAAFIASPIGWIVLGIAALVAVIVLIATKTTWFQTAWRVAWGWIKNTAVDVWNWLKALPGRIGDVFAKIANFITAPWRKAFNFIADAWNNTIGRLHWTAPGFLGGWTISAPQLPHFHQGGVVPGAPGSEMLAVLQAGEKVTPAGGGGNSMSITINGDGGFATAFKSMVRSGQIIFRDSTGQRVTVV